jgi:hypothetical protein
MANENLKIIDIEEKKVTDSLEYKKSNYYENYIAF